MLSKCSFLLESVLYLGKRCSKCCKAHPTSLRCACCLLHVTNAKFLPQKSDEPAASNIVSSVASQGVRDCCKRLHSVQNALGVLQLSFGASRDGSGPRGSQRMDLEGGRSCDQNEDGVEPSSNGRRVPLEEAARRAYDCIAWRIQQGHGGFKAGENHRLQRSHPFVDLVVGGI